MQEKFRQASENIDDLNKWLDKVEREIASQNVPQEDVDALKNQINALKVKMMMIDKERICSLCFSSLAANQG